MTFTMGSYNKCDPAFFVIASRGCSTNFITTTTSLAKMIHSESNKYSDFVLEQLNFFYFRATLVLPLWVLYLIFEVLVIFINACWAAPLYAITFASQIPDKIISHRGFL